jgi:DNA-directed RNA polymerase alpha subunit
MRRLQRRDTMVKQAEVREEKAKPVNLSVDSMSLGTRAEKALADADVTTVGDVIRLLEQGDDALLALPGIGQKALIDIKRFLRAEGLIE